MEFDNSMVKKCGFSEIWVGPITLTRGQILIIFFSSNLIIWDQYIYSWRERGPAYRWLAFIKNVNTTWKKFVTYWSLRLDGQKLRFHRFSEIWVEWQPKKHQLFFVAPIGHSKYFGQSGSNSIEWCLEKIRCCCYGLFANSATMLQFLRNKKL